jgi:NADH-quinone oxidoreductase subunit N
VAVAVLAVCSLTIGNLAAIAQRDVKRILAYSAVSHAGFLLIAVAANSEDGATSLLYYLIPYTAATVGAFAVVAARERELGRAVTLSSIEGLGWERPFLGVGMWVSMLSLAGFPLTGGFLGKLFVLSAIFEVGWWWLTVVGVLATALSLAYYLWIVRALYMRPAELPGTVVAAGGSPPRDVLLSGAVAVSLVVTVGSFFFVQPLVDLARDAAASLPL